MGRRTEGGAVEMEGNRRGEGWGIAGRLPAKTAFAIQEGMPDQFLLTTSAQPPMNPDRPAARRPNHMA
ncbi:MAG: hypothetical protein RJA22_800 [Verrucomicrobiota bacterium]